MMNTTYDENLNALKQLNPQLWKVLTSIEDKNYRTEESRSGQLTLIYHHDNQDYYFHSKFKPEAESLKLIQKSNLKADHIIIFGLGLGFHVKQMLEHKTRDARVLLVEPELEIVKHSLKTLNLGELLKRDDFFYFFGKDLNLLAAEIQHFIDVVAFSTLELIEFPPLVRFQRTFFSAAVELIDNEIKTLFYDFKTRLAEDAMVPTNVLKNVKGILYTRPVKTLKNRFPGKPGFIVSAGPSLDKNVLHLKKIRNRGLIICVDTALKPLLKRGIHPHFTVTADPSYKNYLHLQGTEEDINYFIVSETGISTRVFEDFKDNIFSVSIGRPIVKMIEQNIGEIGEIEAWGSVISLALSFAIFLGLNPISFLGQDFAFTDMRNHCRGTSWEDKWMEYTQELDLLQRREKNSITGIAKVTELPDIYGNKTLTSDRLMLYKNYLEKMLTAFPNKRFINATEGGILGAIENKPLHQVLEEFVYPFNEIDFHTLFRIPKLYHAQNKKKLLKFFRAKLFFFKKYNRKLEEIIEKIGDIEALLVDSLPGLIEESEKLKDSLYFNVQNGEIVEMWSQSPIYDFLKRSRKLEKQEFSEISQSGKEKIKILEDYFIRLRPIVSGIIDTFDSSINSLVGIDRISA
jgi:hypothetical protein